MGCYLSNIYLFTLQLKAEKKEGARERQGVDDRQQRTTGGPKPGYCSKDSVLVCGIDALSDTVR